jgi:hypothetical protein
MSSRPGRTPIEITLANGTEREQRTREQLLSLLDRYDLESWIATRYVIIEQGAVPFSHPVLKLNTRHPDNDDLLLATFLHEQIHWRVLEPPGAIANAIARARQQFPAIPVGRPRGADDELSSYLHVIINYLEWQALRALVGDERARAVIDFWSDDHYTELYRLVLRESEAIAAIIRDSGLPSGTP